jgi:hypothetical protein
VTYRNGDCNYFRPAVSRANFVASVASLKFVRRID